MSLRVIDRRFTQMIAYFLVMNSKRCKEPVKENRVTIRRGAGGGVKIDLDEVVNLLRLPPNTHRGWSSGQS